MESSFPDLAFFFRVTLRQANERRSFSRGLPKERMEGGLGSYKGSERERRYPEVGRAH